MSRFSRLPIIEGEVQHGNKRGRTIWYPTLNITGTANLLSGTYMVRIYIQEQYFTWMGVCFSDRNHCEVHAFEMTWNHRYGKKITVAFLKYIRHNKQFKNLDELQAQLLSDQQRCLSHTRKVLTFWSFDLLHDWHEAYLRFAKLYGEKLITIVASDESILRFKKHIPTFSQDQRIKTLASLQLVDEILPGHPKDFFKHLIDIKPDVLVFGYDQNTQGVEDRYKDQEIPKPIFIKAPSHYPHIYKSSILKSNQD